MTVTFIGRFPAFLALILAMIGMTSAPAAEVTWLPSTGGSWFTSDNWSGGSVPSIWDDVYVNNGTDPVLVSDSAASTRHLYVGRNGFGSLFISSELSNEGTFVGGELGGGSVTVAGAAAAWSGGFLSVLSSAGISSLTVREGGTVTMGGLAANTGPNVTAQVELLVSGSDSRLVSNGSTTLSGETGFTIENGGSASTNELHINTGASVVVSGEDSRLDVNQLQIYNYHTGYLPFGSSAVWVKDGAAMATSSVSTVNSAGNFGVPTLRISGAGSRWDSQEGIVLNAGSSLLVEQGGLLVTRRISSNGTVTLAGGTLQGRVSATFPDFNPFISNEVGLSLSSNGGGTVDTQSLNLSIAGNIFGEGSLTKLGSGTLAVSNLGHSGSTFVREGTLFLISGGSAASGIYVGVASGESATLQTLGTMTADLTIGHGAGATGTLSYTGSLPWNYGNKTLVLGDSGIGLFSLTSGQFLTHNMGQVILGNQADGQGDFQLTGGATSAAVGTISVGKVGQGMLTVSDGASFTAQHANFGSEIGSSGVLSVSGSNGSVSQWNANVAWLGLYGTGEASIGDGGRMQVGRLQLGGGSSGQGLIQVFSGGQFNAVASGYFPSVLGNLGEGILRISDGGTAEFSNGFIAGSGTTGIGKIDVTGSGARLVATTPGGEDTVVIGDQGFGRLAISEGGVYQIGQTQSNTINSTVMGRLAGGNGTAIVSGAGSLMSGIANYYQNTHLIVGQSGSGHLTVEDGGRVAFGTLTIAEKAGSTGTVRLNAGGILEVYQSGLAAGDGTIEFNGGTVRVTNEANLGNLGNVKAHLVSDGYLDANDRTLYVGAAFSGAGNLTLSNTGTVIFNGANTYSGTTFLNHGILRSGTANTFSAASSIVLGDAPEVALQIEHDQTIGAIMGGASVSIQNSTLSIGSNNQSFAFNAGVSGNGGLVKLGTGTMSIGNTNTYTGGTVLKEGAVEFYSLSNFGTGGLTFDGGTLRFLVGNTDISARTVTFAEGGAVLDTNGQTVVIAGSLGNGGTGSLTKTGAGRLILGGANTFTGDTFVHGGILELSNPNALTSDSAVIFANNAGAVLDIRAGVQRLGSISGGGSAGGDISLGMLSQLSVGSANTSTTYGGKILADEGIDGSSLRKVGTGTLTLTGQMNLGGLFIDEGKVTLDGASANIGSFAAWTRLELRNGANLETSFVSSIGLDAGRNGEMLVTGAGSVWRSGANVAVIGSGSYGTLTLADGGAVIAQAGSGKISLGEFFLGTLNIGEYDTPTTAGTLQAATVEGGASRGIVNFNHTDTTTFAANLTGKLDVNQRGSGLTLLTGSSHFMGALSTDLGTLQISNGGSVTSSATSGIATNGTTATLIVTGSGANWTSLSDTLIGHNGGTGYLTISDGATVSDTFALVGRSAGGAGHVTVTGVGSTWTHSAGLVIGTGGSGTMQVSDGGQVSNADGLIGGDAGSSGTVTVTGTGSLWTSNAYLVVGNAGSGILNVNTGGIARVGSTGTGTLTLGNSGAGSGILNIGAAVGEAAIAPGTIQAGTVTGGVGSGIKQVNFNHTNNAYTFAPNLTGSLRVDQTSGTTILTGANTYSGGTIVHGGTLLINGSISGNAVVQSSAILGGGGRIGGDVIVENGGTLSPGNSPGLLTIEGDLTLNSLSTLRMEFGGTDTGLFDQLDVQGLFTAGGLLNLVILDGFTPQLGQSFTIFTGTTLGFDAGSFSLIVSNLDSDLAWDTSTLATTGVVSLVSAVPEPGSAGMILFGLGLCVLLQQRRNRQRA